MTWTDGSVDAHETPWMVVVVGFPAASFSVTVMLNGAPPGQVTGTHASVLIAVTAAVPTQRRGAAQRDAQVVDAPPRATRAGRPRRWTSSGRRR